MVRTDDVPCSHAHAYPPDQPRHGRQFGGGDGTQIRNTAQQLRAVGHDVSMVNSDEPDVRGFDIAHIFNCRVVESFIKQMNCCLQAGIPTVVSPIWINIPKALWGSRGTMGVLVALQNEIKPDHLANLERLKTQELVVSLPEGTVDAKGSGSGQFNWMQRLASCCNGRMACCPTAGWS